MTTPTTADSEAWGSPDAAHVPNVLSVGSIQIAGQSPAPRGRRARTTTRPARWFGLLGRQAAFPSAFFTRRLLSFKKRAYRSDRVRCGCCICGSKSGNSLGARRGCGAASGRAVAPVPLALGVEARGREPGLQITTTTV